MSLHASLLILFVLAVHPFLKRYSKIYSYSLWILVGISLLCPFSIRTPFSLQPSLPDTADFLSPPGSGIQALTQPGNPGLPDISDITAGTVPDAGIMTSQNQSDGSSDSSQLTAPAAGRNDSDRGSILLRLFCALYLIGFSTFVVYYLAQYQKVRRQIAPAVRENGNVWLCETVPSPFIIGIRKPRILLPCGLSELEKSHILLHERTHIRHHDPLARLISLICVCLHWWNPLVWAAACLMEQDMEMFCDESSLRYADLTERKAYAKTLLSCASRQSGLTVGPAFGESNTERRVENIMKKRKNSLIVLGSVILLAIFCSIAFLTLPDTGKHASELLEAPVYFNDFALADGVVYVNYPEEENSGIQLALPIATEFCAIYKNRLYYSADEIDKTVGYVPNGHLTIQSCELDGTDPHVILELPEIYCIGAIMLRDNSLYCSYIKEENDDTFTIVKVSASGENRAEYSLSFEYGGLFQFWKNRAYTRALADGGDMIFYMHDLDTGESKELYRCSDCFLEDYCVRDGGILLLLDDNKALRLLFVSEDKEIMDYGTFEGKNGHLLSGNAVYCAIDSSVYQLEERQAGWLLLENLLPEHIQPHTISPIMEEGKNLYCLISGRVPDNEWLNTFLLQYNTSNKEQKLLREFYLP